MKQIKIWADILINDFAFSLSRFDRALSWPLPPTNDAPRVIFVLLILPLFSF